MPNVNYETAFIAARANAAVGIIAAVLAGTGLTVHPSWLSGDVAATAGVISAISLGLATVLPQVQRTPGARETAYVNAATFGTLPPDLADKHPELAVTPPLAVVPPPVPPQPPPATVP